MSAEEHGGLLHLKLQVYQISYKCDRASYI